MRQSTRVLWVPAACLSMVFACGSDDAATSGDAGVGDGGVRRRPGHRATRDNRSCCRHPATARCSRPRRLRPRCPMFRRR